MVLVLLGAVLEHETGDDRLPHQLAAQSTSVVTDDGATIMLHRYEAAGPPVLVVHGLSSNHHSWDLAPDRSIGLVLQEASLDAWLMDLRGHGNATHDAEGNRQWVGWNIDHYGHHDIPAAIDHIRQETGFEQVAYVGHSLGGMVGAIYAGTHPGGDQTLSSLVAVGSPMDFSDPDPLIWGSLKLARFTWIPVVPSDVGGDFRAMLGGAARTPVDAWVDGMLFNDLSEELVPEMYRRVASPLSRGELHQLALVGEQRSFLDAEGEIDYLESLEQVTTPTLVIAGRADLIAPVDRVLPYYQRVGAERKQFVIAGRSTGFAADYGHLDLTLGDHAAEEIYPLIVDWVSDSFGSAR